MRLFLTGSTGFIGSHVLSAALSAGHEVLALRRSAASEPAISLPCQPVWCDGDLNTLEFDWLEGVDVVLHLASAGVSPKQASWRDFLEVNLLGTLSLLELASSAGVGRVVVSGSCHEYGHAALRYEAIPPDAPLEPLTAYGATKAAAFQLIRTFAIERNLELFYGRIFSAYGEGQYEGNFWPSLVNAALSGSDYPMTSGTQISNFISVSAVAAYLLEASVRPDISPGSPLVVNIGSGLSCSLLAFAQSEWKRLGASGNLLPGRLPDRPNQIERYVPDLCGLATASTYLSNLT
jgi:UDP-glucose 4-epimerase